MKTINSQGLELLKRFEGCRLKAYKDIVGIWTIGYGHIARVYPGQTITQEEADQLLEEDLRHFESGVSSFVKVNLTDNQFSALVCFSYNVGLGSLLKSHLLKRVNTEDFRGAAQEFLRWDSAGGVVRRSLLVRREAERALFLS